MKEVILEEETTSAPRLETAPDSEAAAGASGHADADATENGETASLMSDYDFHDEIIQTEMLFQSHILSFGYKEYSLENYADRRFFAAWKANEECADTDEMRAGLNIDGILRSADPSEGEVLTYAQYVLNIAELCRRSFNKEAAPGYDFDIRNYTELLSRVRALLRRLHYEVKYVPEKEFLYIVPKDPAAEAVTEEASDPAAAAITEYRSTSSAGDLNRKRSLLGEMGDIIERYPDNLRGANAVLFSRIEFMLNHINIRKDNVSGDERSERVAAMSDEEMEKWYDETYRMLLLRMMEHENAGRMADIDRLARECGIDISAITEEEIADLLNGEIPEEAPEPADDIPSVSSIRERGADDGRDAGTGEQSSGGQMAESSVGEGKRDRNREDLKEKETEKKGSKSSMRGAIIAVIVADLIFVLFVLLYLFVFPTIG